jgi:hypothetical protein
MLLYASVMATTKVLKKIFSLRSDGVDVGQSLGIEVGCVADFIHRGVSDVLNFEVSRTYF